MDSILEQQRRYHEERERLVDAMVQEMLLKKSTNREQINSDHRLKMLLEQRKSSTRKLFDLYEDVEGARKSEMNLISGPTAFQEFYKRLKSIKDFNKKHPNSINIPLSVEFDELKQIRESSSDDDMINIVQFTDEEGYGKYLDLHECYEKYINLKNVDKVDYITYLSIFDQFYDINKGKKNTEYKNYLDCLLDYLHGYLSRVKPLIDIDASLSNAKKDFTDQWTAGTFPGWPKEAESALSMTGAYLDLSAFSSWEELASLGLDRLKSALIALGLKCGGTLEERAQRLFSTKGKAQLDPDLMSKYKSRKNLNRDQERLKECAWLEAQVYWFMSLLSPHRQATVDAVQRRQARTCTERDESDHEYGNSSDSEEEGEDDAPYNPKGLPLGWDGKPIPYWLYKLHGLNISYVCEICGNFTYRGPKAYQRHFAEWRHAHGMRCMGVPNTKHFANVTKIEDALSLWERLQKQTEAERWLPDLQEECEDLRGNVVSRKTYEDLKRQGLL